MFLLRLCKDQNVVQVHYHNPFSHEGPEDVVHHSLEGGGTVGHSKEHHERSEEAVVGVKDCFPLIYGLDTYIIETSLDIKLCEVLGSVELGDKFRNEGEGVPVLDGYGVQYTIVLDQPERPIFLFNKNTGATMGDLEGQICLVHRFSSRKASNSVCYNGDRG